MKNLSDLQVLMGRMGKAFFFPGGLPENLSADTDLMAVENAFAMPISQGGVTFEPGAPDVTSEKITEGRTWYTFAEKGDDNISMQVPSLHTDINDLFLTKISQTAIQVKAGEKKFKGDKYSLTPKKVKGAWVFQDREETCMVALPNTDNYANLVGATGDAMSYYNVAISTLSDADGGDVIIFSEDTTTTP